MTILWHLTTHTLCHLFIPSPAHNSINQKTCQNYMFIGDNVSQNHCSVQNIWQQSAFGAYVGIWNFYVSDLLRINKLYSYCHTISPARNTDEIVACVRYNYFGYYILTSKYRVSQKQTCKHDDQCLNNRILSFGTRCTGLIPSTWN